MVEEDELAGVHRARERDRVRDARVPEAAPLAVLGLRVLGVVDERADLGRERVAGQPARLRLLRLEAEVGLVVGDVGDRAVGVVHAHADRRPAVRDRLREHRRRAEPELLGR